MRARETPPTQIITVEDLDREIEALWAQLHALVALKRSLTASRVARSPQ